MKQLSIIVLAALALALLPDPARAQGTCETYIAAGQAVLDAQGIVGGCEGTIALGIGKSILGYRMEIVQRPGNLVVKGTITATMLDGGIWVRFPSAPPVDDVVLNVPLALRGTGSINLKMELFDVAEGFTGRLIVFFADTVATPTPQTSGVCGAGDFYCDHSGVGWKGLWTNLKVGGSEEGGSQTEVYPLGSHPAEPGAWRVRIWGCGSLGGTNQALAVSFLDNDGREVLTPFAIVGPASVQLATSGLILHVPIPRDAASYGDARARELYFRIAVGSFWPANRSEYCNLEMEKVGNNNYRETEFSKKLTIFTGRTAWGASGLSYYWHFEPPASDGSTTMTVENEIWSGTFIDGTTGAQCRSGNASTVLLNGSGSASLTLRAGGATYCAAAGPVTMSKIVITIGPYAAGPTHTPTPSRTPTVSPTPSSTRTLAPAYTRTPTQPSATRTTTLTPTETATASPTITGTRPVEVPCAISVTHEIPVTPGTITIRLEIGMRFVLADNNIFINYGSQAIEINPGSYEWQQATADYVLYSITEPARLAVCIGDSATPTWTASRTITQIAQGEDEYCFPATPIPIDDVNPALPDLALVMPSWTPTVMISITTTAMTTTIAISVTAVIGLISTVETGIISPAARIQTAVAPYSWESGETTGASWAARLDPVLQWLAILNPDNPAWSTAGGPLWALSPVLIYILPIIIVLLGVALIQFVLWLARLLLAALQLVMQVIETITP